MISKGLISILDAYDGIKRRLNNWIFISRLKRFDFISVGSNVKCYGKTILKVDKNAKSIRIGDNFICRSGEEYGIGTKVSKISVGKGASLIIGNNSGISNANIACNDRIIIGDNVNIGFETTIMDSDFHSIDPIDRINRNDVKKALHKEIHIHNNVFIGARCMILKGVEIGENSVVAAGSIVTKSIPANELWGGVIARKISDL